MFPTEPAMTRILSAFNLLKRVGFAVLLLGGYMTAMAQPPDTLWTRRYGNEFYDLAHSVAQTPDGGFIIAGETWDADTFATRNADAYVVKIDSLGNEEWGHRWGTRFTERLGKIIVLEDGYMAAGSYERYPPSQPNDASGWLLRLDSHGDTLWTTTVNTGYSYFEDMLRDEDGNFVCVGESDGIGLPDLWVVKFDPLGNTLWTQTFGGTNWDRAWAVTLTLDGGYAICGFTDSFGNGSSDYWLIKVSPDGDSLWSRTFGFGGLEEARAIALAPDGGFFLGGYSSSLSETYDDAWIVRTDSLGNYMWDKDLAGEFALGIEAMVALDDGGVVAAGYDSPESGGTALYLAKVDSIGESVWARSWFQDWTSYGEDLKQLLDGSFVSVGGVGSHGDPEHTTGDMWFVRLSPDITPVSPFEPTLPTDFSMIAYPNPFNSTTILSFTLDRASHADLLIFDVLGRQVRQNSLQTLSPGTHRVSIDANELASGSYWVQLKTNNSSETTRVLLVR
jgi:hypothetical protein